MLSNRIKALMQLTNTKQVDIAQNLKTTQAYISRLINNADIMRISDLKQIVECSGGTLEISIILPDGTKI